MVLVQNRMRVERVFPLYFFLSGNLDGAILLPHGHTTPTMSPVLVLSKAIVQLKMKHAGELSLFSLYRMELHKDVMEDVDGDANLPVDKTERLDLCRGSA